MKTPFSVSRIFETKLAPISNLFHIKSYSLKDLYPAKPASNLGPGVYVFSIGQEIIRIGKSKTNCIKRSLEHIRDNTRGGSPYYEMNTFKEDPKGTVTYVFPESTEDYFWIAAIEFLFEEMLNPKIPSKRNG